MRKEKLAYVPTSILKHSKATRLYSDFLNAPEKTREYFGPMFDDEAALRILFSQLQERIYPREALASALDEMATDIEAPAIVRTQIDNLRNRDSLVVFAGQQPGLFAGPLYSVYKALTVERWATELSDKFSVPVIPCFWLASDDHDFAEVDHINLPDNMDITTVKYTPSPSSGKVPIGRITLDSTIGSLTKDFMDFFPSSEFSEDVLNILNETYTPGVTYPVAFARLWYRMFPQSQLVFVSPGYRSLKKLAEPVMRQALSEATRLFSIYDETSIRLESNGYRRQVRKNPEQTFLFYQGTERHSIHRDENDNYFWEGEGPVTFDHVCKLLAEKPEEFSGNVLLTPIIQNSLFPTLGVVLGPSEISYYSQIADLHDYFDVLRPGIMPRTSVTLVKKNISKRLSLYDIGLDALQQDVNHEITRVLKTKFPDELDTLFHVSEQRISSVFEEIQSTVEQYDPALNKTAELAAIRAQHELQRLAKKTHMAHRRKEANTEKQIRQLALHLFPHGELQERCFNIVYYWSRFGPDFLAKLYSDWPVGVRDHLLWTLE